MKGFTDLASQQREALQRYMKNHPNLGKKGVAKDKLIFGNDDNIIDGSEYDRCTVQDFLVGHLINLSYMDDHATECVKDKQTEAITRALYTYPKVVEFLCNMSMVTEAIYQKVKKWRSFYSMYHPLLDRVPWEMIAVVSHTPFNYVTLENAGEGYFSLYESSTWLDSTGNCLQLAKITESKKNSNGWKPKRMTAGPDQNNIVGREFEKGKVNKTSSYSYYSAEVLERLCNIWKDACLLYECNPFVRFVVQNLLKCAARYEIEVS